MSICLCIRLFLPTDNIVYYNNKDYMTHKPKEFTLCNILEKGYRFWCPPSWIQILVLLLVICVIVNKLLNLFVSLFVQLWNVVMLRWLPVLWIEHNRCSNLNVFNSLFQVNILLLRKTFLIIISHCEI